jgi:hypothetical protein
MRVFLKQHERGEEERVGIEEEGRVLGLGTRGLGHGNRKWELG